MTSQKQSLCRPILDASMTSCPSLKGPCYICALARLANIRVSSLITTYDLQSGHNSINSGRSNDNQRNGSQVLRKRVVSFPDYLLARR